MRGNHFIWAVAALLLATAAVGAVIQADDADAEPAQYLPKVIMNDLSSDGDFLLREDTFVNEGVTLEIRGSLDFNGKNLIVYGTFVVNGSIFSTDTGVQPYVDMKDDSEVRVESFGSNAEDLDLNKVKLPQFRYRTSADSSPEPEYSTVELLNVENITLDAMRRASDMSDRMLCISSDSRPTAVSNGEVSDEAVIIISGPVTVPEGTELVLEGIRVQSVDGGLIMAEGRLWTVGSSLDRYVGTSFEDRVSVDGVQLTASCYTTFEDALSSGKDMFVMGGNVFEGDLVLDGNRTLHLDCTPLFGEEPEYTIPAGSTFTVAKGSVVTPNEQGFNVIEGTLKVSTDAGYVPAEGSYEDSWIEGGYRVYSGTAQEGGINVFAYIGGALVLVFGVIIGVMVLRRYH